MYSIDNEAASERDAMLHAFATVAQGGTVLHEHRIHLLQPSKISKRLEKIKESFTESAKSTYKMSLVAFMNLKYWCWDA